MLNKQKHQARNPGAGGNLEAAADPLERMARPAPEGGIGGLNDILGFHIRLAYGAVYRHFMESFAHLDLTQKQVSVLWLIDDYSGIAQTDLAQRLQMDRATVMAIVNRLQGRGYIRRGPSDGDKRRQSLWMTPEGHEALILARAAILDHERWLKSRFSTRDIQKLVELLSRIHE